MNDENQERTGRGVINLMLITVVIGVAAIFIFKLVGSSNETDEVVTDFSIEDELGVQTSEQFTITEEQWNALNEEVKELRNEVAQLRKELPQVKKSSVTPSKKTSTTTSAASIEGDANAVTLVSYTHTWLEKNAKLSLKNNTNNTITRISARISYYDMSGNMLDYRDITKDIKIEPQMSRSIQIPGFGTEEHYAYYKSDTFYSQQRKYKVQFKLQSYAIAP